MNTQQPTRPVITPAMREQAAKQPNTWLYVVDPIFTDPNTEVPPWGFIGGYRVDERGELTDDFSPNPNYRPSPVSLRLPAPTNDVERALQLTTTGYAQGHTLLTALLDAELILFAQPQGSGLFTMDHESGRRQLQVFTSDGYLPPNWTTWQRMTGRALTEQQLAGTDVQINPTSPVKARIPGEDLVQAANMVPTKVALAAAPAPPAPAPAPASASSPAPQTNGALNGSVQPRKPTPAASPQAPPPESTQPVPMTKPEPEPATSDTDLGKRFLGAMLAGAIGDALGAAVEFYPVDQIRNRFGERGVADYDRGGDHPGAFTDDTQMTLFTLEGLIRGHLAVRTGLAKSPLPAVQLAYQRWLHTQGHAWPRAAGPFAEHHSEPDGWLIGQTDLFAVRSPGSSCITALREFASGKRPGTFDHPINDAKGCGGVVRAAPVALWSDDPKTVFELAAATAALTHSSPSGYLPAGVQAVLVHRLVRGASLADAVKQARALLVTYAGHLECDRALQDAVELAEQGTPTPEKLKDTLGGGWNGHEALAIALCAALSTTSIAAGLMVAVNHSGDSDSTAAICGNIVGALHGSAALPGVWLRDLQQRDIVETLVSDALAEFSPKPPISPRWAQRYPATRELSDVTFTSTLPLAGAVETPSEPAEPEAEPPADREGRILGCLLGGAVGDALGYPIEQESLESIRVQHGEGGLTDFVDGDRPGGSISDDTQMTLFTLEGLIRASTRRRRFGETEPAIQVQHAYQRWLHTQGFDWKDAGGPLADNPVDGWLIREKGLFVRRAPGTTCIQALHGYAGGNRTGTPTHRLNDSRGCGGVMRAAPAGLWSDDSAEAFRVGALTAALTHGHPAGFLPAGALAVIVGQLVQHRALPEAVETALTELSTWDGHEETTTALRQAIELAAEGVPTAERIQESLGTGSLAIEALAIAVCAALAHPNSFSDAVVLAANHSGNSDSTAAICGNIMGAAQTARAVPEKWREKLELREVISQLARDAIAEFGPNPPADDDWAQRYPVSEAEKTTAEPGPSTEPEAEAEAEAEADAPAEVDTTAEGPEKVVEGTNTIPPATEPEPATPSDAGAENAASADEESGETDSPEVPERTAAQVAVTPDAEQADVQSAPESARDDQTAPEDTAGQGESSEPEVPAAERQDTSEVPRPATDPVPPTSPGPVETTAHAEQVAADGADETTASPETDTEDDLSDEELRLLTAWRKFRDSDEDTPSDLSAGLHKLLVEAFGAERAAQLVDDVDESGDDDQLAVHTPVELDRDERRAGCVLGGAAGDVLGAPWTFADLGTIERENPQGLTEVADLFGQRGAITAISQQSLFVLDGLMRARIRSILKGISAHWPTMVRVNLQHWLGTQGARLTPAVEPTGLAASEALRSQRFPDTATVSALARSPRQVPTAGNPPNAAKDSAATARGASVGFEATTVAGAVTLGAEIAVVTHGHPDGYLPAGALAGLVAALAEGITLAEAVQAVLGELEPLEGSESTVRGLRDAMELASQGPVSPAALEELGSGWDAPEALAIAVAAALSHPNDFASAVSLSATHSGHSAAAAAICGNLMGTAHGVTAIPEGWHAVEVREIADRLVRDAGRISGEVFTESPVPDWARQYLA
jgi:ADP-ribosylglycohydrolase